MEPNDSRRQEPLAARSVMIRTLRRRNLHLTTRAGCMISPARDTRSGLLFGCGVGWLVSLLWLVRSRRSPRAPPARSQSRGRHVPQSLGAKPKSFLWTPPATFPPYARRPRISMASRPSEFWAGHGLTRDLIPAKLLSGARSTSAVSGRCGSVLGAVLSISTGRELCEETVYDWWWLASGHHGSPPWMWSRSGNLAALDLLYPGKISPLTETRDPGTNPSL